MSDAQRQENLRRGAQSQSVTKLVNELLVKAIKARASKLSIEAGEVACTAKLLAFDEETTVAKFTIKALPFVIARIKLMSKIDLAETAKTQSGKTRIRTSGNTFILQVDTQPSPLGEGVVIHFENAPAEHSEIEKQDSKAAVSEAGANQEKATILLIDDSSSIRGVVKFVLESDGYNVIEAEDGEQGWDILQQTLPNLIIADHEMPKLNGTELIARMRGDRRFDSVPAMMLTGKKSEDDGMEGVEIGADEYLAKPVDPARLQARVRKILTMYARIQSAAKHGGE